MSSTVGQNTKYHLQARSVCFTLFDEMHSKFGKVVDICVVDMKIALCLQVCETGYYSGHYDAFVPNALADHHTFHLVSVSILCSRLAKSRETRYRDDSIKLYTIVLF